MGSKYASDFTLFPPVFSNASLRLSNLPTGLFQT